MNRNDLRRVDLNLLIVFETLMHERSVTRAAEKLFLGQPAISAALSRLRSLFDDPLFVRTGRSMEPSARAVEIFALLSPALDSISTAVSRAAEFDPATSTSVFRIGLSDDVEFALLPMLLKRLRAEAPGIVLVVRRVNYILMPGLLPPAKSPSASATPPTCRPTPSARCCAAASRNCCAPTPCPARLVWMTTARVRMHWCRSPVTSVALLMKSWRNSGASARGAGRAAVQWVEYVACRYRHRRDGAGLHGGCADGCRRRAGGGSTVANAHVRTAYGLAWIAG